MEKRGRFSLAAADDIDDDAVAVAVAMVVVAKKRRHSPDWQSLRRRGRREYIFKHACSCVFEMCVVEKTFENQHAFCSFLSKKSFHNTTTSHTVH
jgi:hypothetical protein